MMAPKEIYMDEKKTCCICGKTFYGFGHNPSPIKTNGECCDNCNTIVVMVRLEISLKDKKVLR